MLINQVETPDYVVYIFMKYKLLQARLNRAIGMCQVSEDVSNSIMKYVQKFKVMTPSKFWLCAAKAAETQAAQLSNAREFDDALLLLKNVSTKVTAAVGEHFLPAEFEDKDKQLQDNLYSFTVRKMIAQHQIHFVDFKTAERQLRGIFEDELDYYGIRVGKKEKEEETDVAQKAPASIDPAKETEPYKKPPFKPIDLDKIDLACLDKPEFIESDEFKYSPKSHPLFRIT